MAYYTVIFWTRERNLLSARTINSCNSGFCSAMVAQYAYIGPIPSSEICFNCITLDMIELVTPKISAKAMAQVFPFPIPANWL